jgi:hypothetical protein
MVPTRWGNSPYCNGITECPARNASTARHFSRRWRSMVCAFSSSLRLWLLFMEVTQSKVLISKPRTIEGLKQRMKNDIAAIPEQMTCRVMKNPRGRLERCLRNCGWHQSDVFWKYKMAWTDFFSDNCYIKKWNVIVLFRFENRQPHFVLYENRNVGGRLEAVSEE